MRRNWIEEEHRIEDFHHDDARFISCLFLAPHAGTQQFIRQTTSQDIDRLADPDIDTVKDFHIDFLLIKHFVLEE